MIWHVVTRVGDTDGYEPDLAATDPRIQVAFERAGDKWLLLNSVVGSIVETAGRLPGPAAIDLVYLSMAVYAADLRVPRRLTLNRWSRDLVIHFPVQDLSLWLKQVSRIERTLCFLTGDRWRLELRKREPSNLEDSASKLEEIDAVCLFSGGLDSLVGALDLLADHKSVALVGHYGSGITNSVQERVLKAVTGKYERQAVAFMFYAQPPKANVKDGEPSMRSRSFLFFAMGIAVASALGGNVPLVIAENGLISLNVPLTCARTGSRSTRTTHPHYVALFTEVMARLGLPSNIQMPYRFRTKGEMLRECKDVEVLTQVAQQTMSCSHPEAGRYRGLSPSNHCGYCVPCIIRRAAMKAAGLPDAIYNLKVELAPPAHTEEAGRDYRAFCMALERSRGMTTLRAAFKVLGPGALIPEDIRGFAEVYLRGMEEVRDLLETREV